MFVLAVLAAKAGSYDPLDDYTAITRGVYTIELGGSLPSSLVVWGDEAFPVIVDSGGEALVAAARYGSGRAVHFGHEGMLGSSTSGGPRLTGNALRWAGQSGSPVVGVYSDVTSLGVWLRGQGFTVVNVGIDSLDGVDVIVLTTYTDLSDSDDATLAAWIAAGGGVVSGGHAWYWGYSNDNAAENYPGNQWLRDVGFLVSADYASSGTQTLSRRALNPVYHASGALDLLSGVVDGSATVSLVNQAMASTTVRSALNHIPLDWDWFDAVDDFLTDVGDPVPTPWDPIDTNGEPIEALAVTIRSAYASGLPADAITADPAARVFPGLVSDAAPRVSRTLAIDGDYEGLDTSYWYAGASSAVWRSTGLYVPPGEVVGVTLPASIAGSGVDVLIGAHTDTLWSLTTWYRSPQVYRTWSLDDEDTDVASAFGGLLYVRIPWGASLGAFDVTIDGAVEAPHYVRGDDGADFLSSASAGLVPWAEIESDRFVATVPSTYAAAVPDPSAVAELWVDVLDAAADLSGFSHDRPRAERLVVDHQISAGSLHSGYPIMGYYDSIAGVLDVDGISTSGSWGPFHELGHNHQYADWLLPNTTETTCNLWSVYLSEVVFGVPRSSAHGALLPASREAGITSYLDGGADWTNDWSVWIALETYLQLEEAFGWDPFTDVFTTMREASTHPSNDQERVDEWVRETAWATGYDLGPFYERWGFPVSADVLTEIAELPAWTDDPTLDW